MRSQALPPLNSAANPAPCLILASRLQYRSCHIRVPDLDRAIPAIYVNSQYFSLFSASSDCRKTLSIAVKLSYRGDRTALTKTAKGYAAWVEEPTAIPTQSHRPDLTPYASRLPAACRILVSQSQYQHLEITVPDLDQPLNAICVENNYFSIFRVTPDVEKVFDLVAKLAQRSEETVVIGTREGYAIGILEPTITRVVA